MIPLVVVDRNVIFRQTLKKALSCDRFARVVLEFDHPSAIDLSLFTNEIHVVLIDLDCLSQGMLTQVGQVQLESKWARVVGLSQEEDTGIYPSLIAAGIRGVVLKTEGLGVLVEAIRKVHEGQLLFTNEILQAILNQEDEQKATSQPFSSRELEIIQLICEELSNEKIAERLFLSTSTIKWHRHNIMTKSNTQSALSLYKYAMKIGLLDKQASMPQISQ